MPRPTALVAALLQSAAIAALAADAPAVFVVELKAGTPRSRCEDLAAAAGPGGECIAFSGYAAVRVQADEEGVVAFMQAQCPKDCEGYEESGVFALDNARAAVACPVDAAEPGVLSYHMPWQLGRLVATSAALGTSYPHDPQWGAGVDVYVLDSGVNCAHEELAGRCEQPLNLEPAEGDADLKGHGTLIAGLAAGRVFGVAKQAHVVSLKIVSQFALGPSLASVLAALGYVAERAAASTRRGVVNLSFNRRVGAAKTDLPRSTLERAIRTLVEAGVVVTASAGNFMADACDFVPARVGPVITTAATRMTDAGEANLAYPDTRAGFSNYGACVDVYAPGDRLWGAANTGGYAPRSGTSFAAPLTAGVVAVMLSVDPTATPRKVREWVTRSALPRQMRDGGVQGPAKDKLLHIPCAELPGGWAAAPQLPADLPYRPREENCYDYYADGDDRVGAAGTLTYPTAPGTYAPLEDVCFRIRCPDPTQRVHLAWRRFAVDDPARPCSFCDALYVNAERYYAAAPQDAAYPAFVTFRFVSNGAREYEGFAVDWACAP